MGRRFVVVAASLTLLLGLAPGRLAAQSRDSHGPSHAAAAHHVFLLPPYMRADRAAPSPFRTVVPQTTKVLGNTALGKLTPASVAAVASTSAPSATLGFKKPGRAIKQLRPGDIIVAGVSNDTPNGLLRKVVSVSKGKNRESVDTVAAALPQAIQEGTINASGTIGTGGYTSTTVLRHGVPLTVFKPKQAVQVCYDKSLDLPAGVSDDVNLCFGIQWNLTYSIHLFQPSQLVWSTTTTASLKNSASVTVTLIDVSKSGTILGADLSPVTVFIGPVPVVITPKVSLEGSIDLHAEASLKLDMGAQLQSTSTLQWNSDSGWQQTQTRNPTFTIDPPAPGFDASATADLSAGPRLEAALYDIAGPYVELDGYAKGSINPQDNPCMRFDLGLQIHAGVHVGVENVLDLQYDATLLDKTLKHWDSGGRCGFPTPTSTPTPKPTNTNVPPTATATPTATSVQPTPTPTNPPVQCGRTPEQHCTAIWTDRSQYQVGDSIEICHSVPFPAPIVLVDILADGTSQSFSGTDDGTGGCLIGTITPPTGTERIRLDVYRNNSVFQSAQASFQVLSPQSHPVSTSYEAESSANGIYGTARVLTCVSCSGNERVGYLGAGSTPDQYGALLFSHVTVSQSGTYPVTIYYTNGDSHDRTICIEPNFAVALAFGGAAPALTLASPCDETAPADAQSVDFPSTGSWDHVGSVTVHLQLNGGGTSIMFYNACCGAPDLDRIVVQSGSGGGGGGTCTSTTPGQHCTNIWTDRSQYNVGDSIEICYSVSHGGPFQIVDYPAGQSGQIVVRNVDDGTGDCFIAQASPPTGTEHVEIDLLDSNGNVTEHAQTSFQVH